MSFKVSFTSKGNKRVISDVFEIRYKEKTDITYLLVAEDKKLKWIDFRYVEVVKIPVGAKIKVTKYDKTE